MDDGAADPLRVVDVLRLHDGRAGHRTVQRHLDADQVPVVHPAAQEPDQKPPQVLRPHRFGLRRVPPSELLPDDSHRR